MEPRTSRWDHATAMALAATEHDRCLAHLRRLAEADWTKPTDCSAWDVPRWRPTCSGWPRW
jgi:hypothetical protein